MAKETKNLGRVDRVIRMVIAILCAFVILSNVLGNWGNLILFGLTAFIGYTSLASSCPIYRIVGKSTYSK